MSYNIFNDLGFENPNKMLELSSIFAEICVLAKKNNPSRAYFAA